MGDIIFITLVILKNISFILLGVLNILIHLAKREIGQAIVGVITIYSWFVLVNIWYMPYHTPYVYGMIHLVVIIAYFYREGKQLIKAY